MNGTPTPSTGCFTRCDQTRTKSQATYDRLSHRTPTLNQGSVSASSVPPSRHRPSKRKIAQKARERARRSLKRQRRRANSRNLHGRFPLRTASRTGCCLCFWVKSAPWQTGMNRGNYRHPFSKGQKFNRKTCVKYRFGRVGHGAVHRGQRRFGPRATALGAVLVDPQATMLTTLVSPLRRALARTFRRHRSPSNGWSQMRKARSNGPLVKWVKLALILAGCDPRRRPR